MANFGNHAGFLDSQQDFCQTLHPDSTLFTGLLNIPCLFILPQDLIESIS